ncbi:hypothetical protein A5711_10455 [Mycobacterium sp. E2238]|nr:hypothetical protein A5711_10455 [Mycobacterium sp. E2238]
MESNMADAAAEPNERRTRIRRAATTTATATVVSRLIRPALLTVVVTALITAPGTRPLLPPGCAIGWTMVGHVVIFVPDCTQRSPSPPPPTDGPPGPVPPPAQ